MIAGTTGAIETQAGIPASVNALTAARRLRGAGARDFFVAHWSETAPLLRHVPAAQVSVLHGPLSDADAAFCKASGVKPVLNSLPQIARWRAAGGGLCDLMVDSGINRLGLAMADLGAG